MVLMITEGEFDVFVFLFDDLFGDALCDYKFRLFVNFAISLKVLAR